MMAVRCGMAYLAVTLVVRAAETATAPAQPAVAFTEAPAVKVVGREVRITFAVNRPCDVAVRIVDQAGQPVRHLVAGVLGPNPPAPLKPRSLAQDLEWDGLDDAGRPLPAGAYTVEVALELTPRLDRILGYDVRNLGTIHGLAVGPNGALYVMGEVGRDTREPKILILDARGEYVRTVCPRPAGLPLDRVRPLNELVLNDGTRIPQELLPEHGARAYQQPVVTREGDLIFLSGRSVGHNLGHRYYSVGEKETRPRRLLRLASDGGAPAAGYLGPILGKGFEDGMLFLALAPDGETIYVSGARHAVFKVRWGQTQAPVPVVGTPDAPGAGEAALRDPAGMAVDRAGRLYVADRGNHRVAVFTPDGKYVAELPLEWPRDVLVHPVTGAIYVTAGFRQKTLLKFASIKDPEPAARLDLRTNDPIICLDPSAAEATLYAGNVGVRVGGAASPGGILVRLTDGDGRLRVAGELSKPGPVFQPRLLGVNRQDEMVFAMAGTFGPYVRVDGLSAAEPEVVESPLAAKANGIHELTVGGDGTVAIHVTGEFGRLDRHLHPFPFRATGSFILVTPQEDCIRSFYDRGAGVAPNGDIYWIHERGGYSKPMLVTALNADGTVKKDPLITFESRSPAGIRVDRQGHVYVIDHLKPLGRILPEAFEGRVPIQRTNRFVYNYGSLLKFRPEGGAIRELARGKAPDSAPDDGRPHYTTAEGRGHFVGDGVMWSYYGASMIQPALDRVGCQCWSPRFDLDEFARVFVPDQLRCTVHVLDTNGNPIVDIGSYGNVDAAPPAIALADPRTVMVSDEAAYIGDMTNNRIVRVALDYAARGAAAVTLPAPALPDDLAAIEEAWAGGPAPAERGPLVAAAARLRVEALRRALAPASPVLEARLDWSALASGLAAGDVLPTETEARVALCLAAREVAGWPPAEAKAVLAPCLADQSEWVRLAAVYGLWGETAGSETKPLLRQALADRSALVRVTAAVGLLELNDPAGVAEVLRAARSPDPNVFKLGETAVIRKVAVWDNDHPQARLVDPTVALVPRFPLGRSEAEALVALLETDSWYLRRVAIIFLGLSGQDLAAEALRPRLAVERNRNLNRTIGALGLLRDRLAVPELIRLVQRGRARNWGTDAYDGDQAERFAAEALVRIGAPAAVEPLIALLTSEKPTLPELARRTLSRLFDPAIPDDRVLVPATDPMAMPRLERVRVDDAPPPADLGSLWEAFWKAHRDRYETNPAGPGLRQRE